MLTETKLLFLARLFTPHVGGVETHVAKLSAELQKRGYAITVITEEHDKTLPQYERIDGVAVYRIPQAACSSKVGVWAWMIRHLHLFLNADIVHAHDVFWWYLPIRLLLCWKPVYTTFHGYEGIDEPTEKAIRSRRVSERLSRGTICIGDWMRKWYGAKPKCVSYGAGDLEVSPLPKNHHAVFIGRLAEDTGILEYIRGVALLKGKVNLDIYGEGELLEYVQKMIGRYPYIEYKGVTKDSGSTLKKYRYACVSRYLSMIEAMQVGRYIFAHWNNRIKRDYLQAFPAIGKVSIFNLPEEFAEELGYMMDHVEKERQQMKMAGEWATKQTWNHVADMYEELWTK